MISALELESLKTLNEMISKFRVTLEKDEKDVKQIDEKYRKLAEQEKKELATRIAACKKEIAFWEKPVQKRYGKTLEELLNGDGEPADVDNTEPVSDDLPFFDEEEEKVVDMDVKSEASQEEPEETPVEETHVEPEAQGKPEPVAESVAEESTTEESDNDWGDGSEAKGQKKIDPDDDEWPDFNKEW